MRSPIRFLLALFFLGEVLAGPLRYYLGSSGATLVAYGPKAGLALAVLLVAALRPGRRPAAFFATLLVVVLVSLWQGYSPLAAGVGLNSILPFFAGLFLLESRDWPSTRITLGILLVACAGVVIDYFLPVPWAGASTTIAGLEVTASKVWWQLGSERVAGFARSSTLAATQIIVLYAMALSRLSPRRQAVLGAVAGLAIFLTTSKASLFAFALVAAAILAYYRVLDLSASLGFPAFFAGAGVPYIAILFPFVISWLEPVVADDLLFSVRDRLTSSWPSTWQFLIDRDALLSGIGTAGTSASQTLLGLNEVLVDNLYLYSIVIGGLFGFLGLVLLITVCLFRLQWASLGTKLVVLAGLVLGVTGNVVELGVFSIVWASSLREVAFSRALPNFLAPAPVPVRA